MPAAHPDRPADRLALFLNALVRAVADTFPKAQQGQLLLWQRLMHLGARFTAILTAARRPRSQRPPSPRPARPPSEPPSEPPPTSPPKSPRIDFGLLFRQLPGYEKQRSQMENLLQEPGIAELLQTTPQLRRVLNPLCRMLNLQPLPPPPPKPQSPGPQTPATNPAGRQTQPKPRLTPGLFASPAQAQPVPRSCGPPPPPSLWSCILRELDRRKLRAAKAAPAKAG